MTDREFCYWLQGFAELSENEAPTGPQWKMIREHLATVFHKVTPQLDLSKLEPTIPYDRQQIATTRPLRAECNARFTAAGGRVDPSKTYYVGE